MGQFLTGRTMAGTEELFAQLFGGASSGYADLTQFEKTVGQNDLWSQAAMPVLGAKFDTSTWSPGQTIGVTAGQAFLGSLLQAIGQHSQANQLEAIAPVLGSLYKDPLNTVIPESVDREAAAGLRLSALKENALRENKTAEGTEDIKDRIFASVFSENPKLALGLMPETAHKLGLDKIGDLKLPDAPLSKEMQKEVLEEAKTNSGLQRSLDFIDDKFEEAKKLTGKSAALTALTGFPTEEGQTLSGMGESITYQIDNNSGRELNSDVRKRFQALAPKWYDTDSVLNAKKKEMKDLLLTIPKATPLTGNLKLEQSIVPSTPDIASFIAKAKAAGLSKEEARIEWQKMGGQ